MTIHGLLRAETLELLVDVRTTWEACSSAESHDPLLHTLTQGVWVESKELLQMTILRKTVVRVPGFPGRKPICAFQNVPFSYSYETKESLNLIYTSCNLPSKLTLLLLSNLELLLSAQPVPLIELARRVGEMMKKWGYV